MGTVLHISCLSYFVKTQITAFSLQRRSCRQDLYDSNPPDNHTKEKEKGKGESGEEKHWKYPSVFMFPTEAQRTLPDTQTEWHRYRFQQSR